MTPREKETMELIRKSPRTGQKEIAQRPNIRHLSVAAHINNLSQEGHILRRGYLLRQDPYLVVVGGTNMDFRGIPQSVLKMKDSNLGSVQSSPGGVGRNIAENLTRLPNQVYMICMLGDDQWGRAIMGQGFLGGHLSYEKAYILPGRQSPVYLEILDENEDMLTAINDMTLVGELTQARLAQHKRFIGNASYVVLDTNLPQENLAYLLNKVLRKYLVDGVSGIKVIKIKDHLDRVHLSKVNRYEAAALVDLDPQDDRDYPKLAKALLKKGLSYLVITYGKEGAWAFHKKETIHPEGKVLEIKNAAGAGDAFTAGLAYALGQGKSLRKSLYFAMGVSRLALKSKKTNAEEMSIEGAKREIEEVFEC